MTYKILQYLKWTTIKNVKINEIGERDKNRSKSIINIPKTPNN